MSHACRPRFTLLLVTPRLHADLVEVQPTGAPKSDCLLGFQHTFVVVLVNPGHVSPVHRRSRRGTTCEQCCTRARATSRANGRVLFPCSKDENVRDIAARVITRAQYPAS